VFHNPPDFHKIWHWTYTLNVYLANLILELGVSRNVTPCILVAIYTLPTFLPSETCQLHISGDTNLRQSMLSLQPLPSFRLHSTRSVTGYDSFRSEPEDMASRQ
jgi:hypothetical protein